MIEAVGGTVVGRKRHEKMVGVREEFGNEGNEIHDGDAPREENLHIIKEAEAAKIVRLLLRM